MMKFLRAIASRRPLIITGVVAGLIVVCTITATFGQSDVPEPSAEDDFGLHELAVMFGYNEVQGYFWDLALEMGLDGTAKEAYVRSFNEIGNVIAASGINTDFTAPPPPTGDELFDAYAVEVDQKLNSYKAGDPLDVVAMATVPDDVLDTWEERFGDDPRYWELRYLLELMAIDMNAPAAEQAALRLEAVEFLREARRRDCASANTLLLLYEEVRRENEARLEEFSDYEGACGRWSIVPPNYLRLRPQYSDDVLARAVAVHTANETLEQELLDAAVALGPDEAWPYYFRGIHSLSLGELETGLSDLQDGNAAPVNSYPRPFPMAFIDDTLATSTPAGGPVVCGAMLITQILYPQPDYITVKNHIREAAAMVELGAPLELYDAWHGFVCRYGEAWPGMFIQSFASLSMIGVLRNEMVQNHQAELSQAQLDTLNRIQGAKVEFARPHKLMPYEYDWATASVSAIAAGGLRGMTLAFYLQSYLDTATVTDHLVPLFNDLAEVSYLELSTPSAMLKYELLPDELYEERLAARKAAKLEANAIEDAVKRVSEPR